VADAAEEPTEDVGATGEQGSLRLNLHRTLALLHPLKRLWMNPKPLSPQLMKARFAGYAPNQSSITQSPIVITELAMSVLSALELCTRKQSAHFVR
jgi:hypothetical protein